MERETQAGCGARLHDEARMRALEAGGQDARRKAVRRAGLEVERVAYLPSHLPGWNRLERAFGRWVGALRRRIGIVAVQGAER